MPAADGGDRAGALAAAVAPAPAEPAIAFVPSSQELLAPSGAKARFAANVAALETLRVLEAERRAATPEEQAVLARWGGWGHNTLWHVFDENKPEWAAERAQLRELLSDSEYDAARRTTINAHYTDPALVQPIWQALQDLGFEGGRVLEPGCGAGTFIGLAPATAEMVGIELDPITAGIAAHLYPNAQVRNESFAATVFPTGHFDAAVGNVPFADVTLHDPRYNSRRLSMHNHFIAKSLELTRPGGMVAFITSTYTMDSTNPAARRAFAEHADLVAAIRLPNGAHRRAAGTEAGSDLLILRRREDADGPGEPFDETAWVEVPNRASEIPDATERLRINRYWLDHPDHVLGTMVGDVGAYGAFAMQVEPHPGRDAHEALRAALAAVVADAREQGLVFAPRTAVQQQRAAGFVPAMPDDIDGMLIANPGGGFSIVEDGSRVPLRLPRGVQGPELAALLRLRDQTRALIAAEAANLDDTPQLDTQRQTLAMSWRSYVKAYGPINRYSLRRTGRVDPDTGEEAYARITPPAVRLMLGDPYGALVLALEVFDGDRQTADPAGILANRQIVPRQPVQGVETASDGLAVVLDTVGRVDVDEIARLMGVDRAEAIEQLGDQVFEVPGGDRWATRAEYLSGNVREKLDAARAADLNEPGRWAHHIADLEAVLPRDIPAGDISTTVGAIWIADEDYTAFLNHLTDSTYCKVKRLVGSSWDVDGGEWGARATAEFGTSRLPAGKLFKKMLGQEPIEVYDTTEDKKRVLNTFETTAAVEKAQVVQEAFNDWIWRDPERAARLVAEYNRRFNSTVLRDYTYEGSLLTFPGLTKSFTPRPHQRAAIARMIHEPSVGLFHSVGAGKTAEMIIGISELKRLGLIHKAAMVVPNHMLNQFASDWLQLYPQAKILAASSDDLTTANRRRFIAKIATNDWDAVIMTRTAFQRIQLSPENEQAFEQRQIATAREQIARLKAADGSGSGAALRRIEKQLVAREEKLRAQRDVARDDGLNWEQTGFDYLGVDELHDFKNLQTISAVRDVNIDGSKRAMDLFAKIDYHRNTLGQDRVMVGATATPIANSIAEMYVMQRYLDPGALQRVGIEDMDCWIATFAEVVTAPELSVAGGERLVWKNRVAKFNNVPELLAMFHAFGDVKTPADLNLPTPALAARPEDGERLPHTLIVPASDALTGYTKDLGERADRVSGGGVDPSQDNMLKIGTDGRLAALDVRLVGLPHNELQPTKVSTAATLLHRVWEQTRDYTYLDATGQPSPVRGALQIVFCDLSTPGSGFHVYGALKDALVERGMPPEEIRFIHEARNDNEKAQLLESCRNGHVAVLIGSTPKMGTGVNIQHRVIHLMHLDAPWRPADLTQRDGRGIRQLNQNPEVMVTNVVTSGSFDAFLWSTLERKARFIDQVMTGRGVERSVEDIGQAALNYAEIKASIAGNPLLMEHAEAERDLARLTRLAKAHERSEWSLRATIKAGEEKLAQIATDLPTLAEAAARTVETGGEAFRMEVFVASAGRGSGERPTQGVLVTDRTAAVQHLQRALSFVGQPTLVARLGGHDIYAQRRPGMKYGHYSFQFTMPDAPGVVTFSDDIGVNERCANRGTVTRLENLTAAIPKRIADLQLMQPDYERSVAQAKEVQGRPFPKADELAAAQQRYADVTKALADSRDQDTATEPGDSTTATPTVVTGPVLDPVAAPPSDVTVPGPPHPHLQQPLQHATRLQEKSPGLGQLRQGGVRY